MKNKSGINNDIGEFFELEFTKKYEIPQDIIGLNCARNCLRYVMKAFNIKEIQLPFYTCPVVWQACQKENCKISFYHIDKNFMPEKTFDKDDFILYTNYFGICAKNVKELSKQYKNLIVDNAQAFYMPKIGGIASFNSLRKFFGVPDGAFLYTDKILNEKFKEDMSFDRCEHMLKRIDLGEKASYKSFCLNEDKLINSEIKTMSKLTRTIIQSLDIQGAKEKRLANFKILNSALKDKNLLKISLDKDDIPMAYPFFYENKDLRKKLEENNVFSPTFWNPTSDKYLEGKFQKYLIPLPIDQRYGEPEMQKIIDVILNFTKF